MEYSCFTNIIFILLYRKSALAIHVHISSLFWTSFPFTSTEHWIQSSLYSRLSLVTYFMCSSVYIYVDPNLPTVIILLALKSIQHSSNHFNVYNSLAFHTFPMLCSHHLCLLLNHFSSAQNENFLPVKQSLLIPLPVSLWQLPIFSSLCIYLFWIFHTNWIIQYVTLTFCGDMT